MTCIVVVMELKITKHNEAHRIEIIPKLIFPLVPTYDSIFKSVYSHMVLITAITLFFGARPFLLSRSSVS